MAKEHSSNRGAKCIGCVLLAGLFIFCGWFIPAHLRAVESVALARAGRGTPGVAGRGEERVKQRNLGAAQLLSMEAQALQLPDNDLKAAIATLATDHPEVTAWGAPAPAGLVGIATTNAESAKPQANLTDIVILRDSREKVLALLQPLSRPVIQALLQSRALTNTTIFAPSSSAAGQSFDAAVCIAGLLAGEERMNKGLESAFVTAASQANQGGDTQPLEALLLDVLSLGQRMNWGQLTAFLERIEDAPTLHALTAQARDAGEQLPALFSTVELSASPRALVEYMPNWNRTDLTILNAAMRYGAGAVNELERFHQPVFFSEGHQHFASSPLGGGFMDSAAQLALQSPPAALAVKWFFYLAGGFFLGMALHFFQSAPGGEGVYGRGGAHVAREALFALGFLFVVLLLSEPFLARESLRVETPIRLHLPSVGGVVPARPGVPPSYMNPINLLTLLLFFVLQALIYLACLVKLGEIRRANVASRIKLKLLENEDHLFDAGLYLGFCGTIVSLILVSLGVIKPSLMAAYSSTSFGIIFVSIFKIFHLRPARRALLLDAEARSQSEAAAPVNAPRAPA